MTKILISWIATLNDFFERNEKGELIKAEGGINEKGPHTNLYKHFTNFDKHFLLCQSGSFESAQNEWIFLANYLRKEYKKDVQLEYLNITDPTNVGLIKGKVEDFLNSNFSNETIEVFINPGSPAMQTTWYLIGMSNHQLNLSLFKIIEARFTGTGLPSKYPIVFEKSDFAIQSNILELDTIRKQKNKGSSFFSNSLENVYEKAKQLASNNASSIVILGETGTGKEIIAKHIHKHSNRSNRPFIALNCGAFINEDLLESRLFGYEKGAFTNANQTTPGAFEKADGGTLFLDEIGDTSPKMQATLLRVLQEKKISRVGSVKEISIDVRIITASHKNLWDLCHEGKFRFDLFYRLAITELELPPFRSFDKKERENWISHFLEKKNVEHDKPNLVLSKEVWQFLLTHDFPGNIRELENLIDRFYYLIKGREVVLSDLPSRYFSNKLEDSQKLEDVKKRHIQKVFEQCDGNKSRAAVILGITRQMVDKYLKE